MFDPKTSADKKKKRKKIGRCMVDSDRAWFDYSRIKIYITCARILDGGRSASEDVAVSDPVHT